MPNMFQNMEGLKRAMADKAKDREVERWRESINPGSSSSNEDGILVSLAKKLDNKFDISSKLDRYEARERLKMEQREPTENEKEEMEEEAELAEKEEENRSIFVKVATEFLMDRVIKMGKEERVPANPIDLRGYDFRRIDVLNLKEDDLMVFASDITWKVAAYISREVFGNSTGRGGDYVENGDQEKIREMVEVEARKMIPVRQERLRTKKSAREEQDAQKIEELRIQIQGITGFRGAQEDQLGGESIQTVE